MLPSVCRACGGQIIQPVPENVNVCAPCFSGAPEQLIAIEEISLLESRGRVSDEVHRRRRRSPAVGDHSHERKTPPSLLRRKH